MSNKYVSIAIPAYEQGGKGVEVLEHNFHKLSEQTFQDFDVVVSDDSQDDGIKRLCEEWSKNLDIKYCKNKKRGAASNTNNAILKSTGVLIKLLCQDDFFLHADSLEKTVEVFDHTDYWLASAYWHTYDRINFFKLHVPSLNPHIYVINTIGTPSCITIRNMPKIPEIDQELHYCYDCLFYYEFIKLYGHPKILNIPTMGNYLWEKSITNSITQEIINKENNYILNKINMT